MWQHLSDACASHMASKCPIFSMWEGGGVGGGVQNVRQIVCCPYVETIFIFFPLIRVASNKEIFFTDVCITQTNGVKYI